MKLLKFLGTLGVTIGILAALLKASIVNAAQVQALGIFFTFIYGTLFYGEFRLAFAFVGIAVLMIRGLLTVPGYVSFAALDVITFLIGTFLVIGYLEEKQFFEQLVGVVVRIYGKRPQLLVFMLMLFAAIASALVGEVTAILFMAGAMLHLAGRYRVNPVPFVLMLVFACNTGSSMSSIGNPIGVLIALKTGLSFMDFVKYAAPTAVIVNVVVFYICRWWWAAEFAQLSEALTGGTTNVRPEAEIDPDVRKAYPLCWALLIGLVALLSTHGVVEHALGLHEGTMMVAAALLMGGIVLFIEREKARELVERRVDWWTLAFFMMLFASVGTLEETRVTEVVADGIKKIGGGQFATIQIIGWATGWLSAFLDNVLAVATFMPVVHDIRAQSPEPYSSAVYWFMLFGGTFMGNMTIIGSTANIVAVGLLEKRGHGSVGFGYWFKIGFIVAIASMLVATVTLSIQKSMLGMPMMERPAAVAVEK